MLDAPAEDTVAGLRDRAILSVGLQVGLRRAEIAALTVGDLHHNEERFSLTAAEPTYRIFAERLVRRAAKRKTLFIMTRKLITTTRNTR